MTKPPASGPVNVPIVAVLRAEFAAAVEETWMSTMVIAMSFVTMSGP